MRPKHVTDQFLAEERNNYLVEQLKVYFDRYPQMFRRDKQLSQRFLNYLKGDRIKLRKFPDVVEAMFEGREEEIPEDLRPDLNTQKSPMLQRFEEHVSRRQSLMQF